MPSAPRQPEPAPSVRSSAVSRLLVLLGLSGFAFSQPMLALLGDNPLVFTFYDVDGVGLVSYVVALTLVPPLVLWVVGLGATALDRRVGRWVHLATVAVLTWLAAVQILKAIDIERPALVAIGATAAAAAFTLVYDRVRTVRTWAAFTCILPFMAIALFLFSSPSGDLLRSADAAASATGGGDALPPVVFLVFDEFPTMSILDEQDEIDELRFPNLASFAEDATWYRRHTSLAASTRYAVPSLLTGGEPKLEEPLWTSYPDSLFSLLAPDYDLTAFETATELCGLDECIEGPPGGTDEQDPRYGDLWSITTDLYRERVSVQPNKGERLDTFAEEVEAPIADSASGDQVTRLEQGGFGIGNLLNRPKRFNQFLDSLEPREGVPALFYLHLMLPHQPWRFHPNGDPYEVLFGFKETYPFDAGNNGGDWLTALTEQRHLLQAQYTDALLGQITERLEENGLYDESLIVVVADHGVTFEPGVQVRRLNPDSLDGIAGLAYTPLLIKAPGQSEGAIDDASMMSIDLLPTVADMIGIDLPFEVDGEAAGSPELADRGDERIYFDLVGDLGGSNVEVRSIREFSGEDHFPRATDRWIPPMEAGAGPMDGLYGLLDLPRDILGQSLDELAAQPGGRATVMGLRLLREPEGDGPRLGLVTGQVTQGAVDDGIVLLAIDGKVVAASPLFRYADQDDAFAMLLPPGVLSPEGNDVRAVLLTDDAVTELELAEGA